MLYASPVGLRISGEGAIRFGLNSAMVATTVALLSFVGSWVKIPLNIDDRTYFELPFWGGGHVLQFVYTLLILISQPFSLEHRGVIDVKGKGRMSTWFLNT